MNTLSLAPVTSISGVVHLPGSKSISNRALLLAALASGNTRIHNLLDSIDTRLMREALGQLGVRLHKADAAAQNPRPGTETEAPVWSVEGRAGPLVTEARRLHLDLGLAGTALRPLTAALTLGQGEFVLDGEPRMRERPIGHLLDALQALGADITCLQDRGYPPIRVRGTGLDGGRVSMDGSISSQFLTALLMAAPLARAPVTIDVTGDLVSRPYIAITLDLMRRFHAEVEEQDYQRFIIGNTGYRSPGELRVEGDASSASYFLAAGAISGAGVRVQGIGRDSVQGDIAFANLLRRMGARVEWQAHSIQVRPGRLRGLSADLNEIPDAAMTLAVLALFAEGRTSIHNVANWRVKETDRLAAMAAELRKVGAGVEEGADYLLIDPPTRLQPASIRTYGDHRMAMCFSLVALGGVAVEIQDPDCVAKTFPDYFDRFAALGRR